MLLIALTAASGHVILLIQVQTLKYVVDLVLGDVAMCKQWDL